jgi:hypothetical protein
MIPNQRAAANHRWNNSDAAMLGGRCPAAPLDDSDNLPAILAADRAFPAAVAELDR